MTAPTKRQMSKIKHVYLKKSRYKSKLYIFFKASALEHGR